VWPRLARWTAVARPMPEFAPVTTVTVMSRVWHRAASAGNRPPTGT
jgi:hypothetical protein